MRDGPFLHKRASALMQNRYVELISEHALPVTVEDSLRDEDDYVAAYKKKGEQSCSPLVAFAANAYFSHKRIESQARPKMLA
jgi:hypothetical protein